MAQRLHESLSKISIAALRQRIAILREADLREFAEEAAADCIKHVIDQYPFQLRPLHLTGVYRARANKPGEMFSSASELWYPPERIVRRPSRLNGIGQVRFYASSMPNTAVLELRPKSEDVFTILLARTRSGHVERLNVAFIGLERSLAPEVQHFTDRDLFRRASHFREAIGPENYEKWLLIDDYLSEVFGTPVPDGEEHRYKPTIALANLLFTAPTLDAVNYPSVASDQYGINLCMLPDKADQLLSPKEAWMVKMGERAIHPKTRELLWRIEFIRRSKKIEPDGTITWRRPGQGINEAEILRFARRRLKAIIEWPLALAR